MSNFIPIPLSTVAGQIAPLVSQNLFFSGIQGTVSLIQGGTGATTASAARTNLGLGGMAVQAPGSVAITGGSITGLPSPTNGSDAANKSYVDAQISAVPGNLTFANIVAALAYTPLKPALNLSDLASASAARTNLGLGTAATVNTGTSGSLIPLLSGSNTWSGTQTLSGSGTALSVTNGVSAGSLSCSHITQQQFSYNYNGSMLSNAWLVLNTTGQGLATGGQGSQAAMVFDDTIDGRGATMSNLYIQHTLDGAARMGLRESLSVHTIVNTPGHSADPHSLNYSAAAAYIKSGVNYGGTTTQLLGNQQKNQPPGSKGSLWGHFTMVQLRPGATNWRSIYGHEIDIQVAAGASVSQKYGLTPVLLSGDSSRGTIEDAALSFGIQDGVTTTWENAMLVGGIAQSYPLGTDSTVLATRSRRMGGITSPAVFKWGIDFREATVTAGGASFAARNWGADSNGQHFGNGLVTTGAVKAQTAGVGSISVRNGKGGVFTAVPTLTVDAPPSGGTQATATVATMTGAIGDGIYNATGKNYLVGDVLTLAGTGLVGTAPTISVTAVDPVTGAITAVTLASGGSLTGFPANPCSTTGGTGTGACFWVVYDSNSPSAVSSLGFGATGVGFAVGDTLTPQGGTGTAPVWQVSSVTAAGAITGTTLVSGGSLTALPATNPTWATNGAGTAAQMTPTYAAATVTVTAGSGYAAFPPPVVYASQGASPFTAPLFDVTMTVGDAPLSIDPAGQGTKHGGGIAAFGVTPPASKPSVTGTAPTPGSIEAQLLAIIVGAGLADNNTH